MSWSTGYSGETGVADLIENSAKNFPVFCFLHCLADQLAYEIPQNHQVWRLLLLMKHRMLELKLPLNGNHSKPSILESSSKLFVVLGGLVFSVLSTSPKVRGWNPEESDGLCER
jgi:hypothetical protein